MKNHVNCLRRILLSVRYIRPREGEYAHGHNFHYTPCQSTGKTIYIFNYYLWTERLWKFLWLCGIHGGVAGNAVKDVCIVIYIKAMQNFLQALNETFRDRVWFVGLQGSFARGEATETSDIDVVVILDVIIRGRCGYEYTRR